MLDEEIPIGLRIKAGIQGESGAGYVEAEALGKLGQARETIGQQAGVMDVDGGDGQGAQDKAMIIDDRELLFPFLVFMARIADIRPPFLTTVLEPSPCKIETSS